MSPAEIFCDNDISARRDTGNTDVVNQPAAHWRRHTKTLIKPTTWIVRPNIIRKIHGFQTPIGGAKSG